MKNLKENQNQKIIRYRLRPKEHRDSEIVKAKTDKTDADVPE